MSYGPHSTYKGGREGAREGGVRRDVAVEVVVVVVVVVVAGGRGGRGRRKKREERGRDNIVICRRSSSSSGQLNRMNSPPLPLSPLLRPPPPHRS